jgi:hypothetical protein
MQVHSARLAVLTLAVACMAACSGLRPEARAIDLPAERSTPFAAGATAPAPGLQLHRHGRLDEAAVSRIEDPVQRGAMRMAKGLVTEDRRRLARGFGEVPLDSWSLRERDSVRILRDDERRSEARAEHLRAIGPAMLRGPLRDAIRELPFARDAEVTIDEFCAVHAPFREERSTADSSVDRGRLAIRVRAGDLASSTELGYRYRSFHALTSAERVRVRFDVALAERATARVAFAHHYADSRADLRLEIGWQIDADTRLHVALGNRMGPLPTPSHWPGADPADETGSGLAFFVEQVF